MDTPETIKPHEPDYKPQAWERYSLAELGQWVHLLAKRAEHRSDPVKAAKDLYDARNYHAMMASVLDGIEGRLPK